MHLLAQTKERKRIEMIKRIIITFSILWIFSGILIPTVLFNLIYPKMNDPDFWVKSAKAMEVLNNAQSIWILGVIIIFTLAIWNFTKIIKY